MKPKHDVLQRMKESYEASRKIPSHSAGTGRKLTLKEQREKTKDWPKAVKGGSVAWPETAEQKREHQRRFGRAWND